MILFEKYGMPSAAQPAERALRPRRRRSRRVDHGRSRRRRRRRSGAAPRADPQPRARRRATAWRRHDRAGAGQGQDRSPAGCGPMFATTGPSARARPAAGGAVPLFARSPRRASRAAPRRLCRDPAGRRLRRLRRALSADTRRRGRHRGTLLGPCAAAASSSSPTSPGPARRRLARSRVEAVRQIDADLRPRARRSTAMLGRRPARLPPRARSPRWSASSRGLDERRASEALAPCRGRQGHRLHAEALARLHALPR